MDNFLITITLSDKTREEAELLRINLQKAIEMATGQPVAVSLSMNESDATVRKAARLFIFSELDKGTRPSADLIAAWARRYDLFPETIAAVVRLWNERHTRGLE
jgi:hypothetical protein